MRRTPVLLAVVIAILLSTPSLAASQSATPSAMLPHTPVGDQLAWMLEELRGGPQSLTPEAVTAHFAPEFLGAVPAEQLVPLTQQLATALGDFTFEGFTRPPTATQANALLTSADGTPWVVPISVAAASPHHITGLNFAPVPPPSGVSLAPVIDSGGTPTAGGPDRIDGLFDVGGGRQLYLSCVGTGSPVDASHEEQNVRLEAIVGPDLWEQLEQRLAQAQNPEGLDLDLTFDQMRAARAAASLPPMPLVVVTAGLPADPALLPPGWPVEEDAALWQELQADLAALVPGGRQVIAAQSGHYVHQSEPDLVFAAIEQVIGAVREPGTWASPEATPAA